MHHRQQDLAKQLHRCDRYLDLDGRYTSKSNTFHAVNLPERRMGTWTWTVGSCDIASKTSQSSCTSAHGTWTWTVGNCNLSAYTTQSTCQAATATWTPNSHSTWNGCVTDRGTSSGPDTTNNPRTP